MYGGDMFPIIDKRETGINIRKSWIVRTDGKRCSAIIRLNELQTQ